MRGRLAASPNLRDPGEEPAIRSPPSFPTADPTHPHKNEFGDPCLHRALNLEQRTENLRPGSTPAHLSAGRDLASRHRPHPSQAVGVSGSQLQRDHERRGRLVRHDREIDLKADAGARLDFKDVGSVRPVDPEPPPGFISVEQMR